MNNPSVVTSVPFNFRITSQNQSDVLFITNKPEGETVNVEVRNQTGNPVTYKQLASSVATVDNHHFELRFRPGILEVDAIDSIGIANHGWMVSAAVNTLDGTVSVYVLKTATAIMEVNGELILQLTNLKIDGTRGARSSNVEINFKNLLVQDDEFSGRDLERVGIINQIGLVDMPLRFYFRYFNKVLNDNRKQKLTLDFFNSSSENVIRLTPESQFIISFDTVGSPALHTDINTIRSVSITGGTPGMYTITPPDSQDQNPKWVISVNQNVEVGQGESLSFTIDNIKADQAGITNMYISYRNIPSYQDNMSIMTIERTPIHVEARDGSMSKNVGIGTNSPSQKLHVSEGNAQIDGDVKIQGNTGIGTTNPQRRLHVEGGDILLTDNSYAVNKNEGPELIFKSGIETAKIVGVDERASNTGRYQGGLVMKTRVHTGGSDNGHYERMRITHEGRVGIGTSSPTDLLHVDGKIRANDMLISGHLDVNGDLRTDGPLNLIPDSDNSGDAHVRVRGNTPIVFRRYNNIGDYRVGSNTYNTNYSSNDYNAAVTGFWANDYDYDENGTKSGLRVRMLQKSGKWHIEAEMPSHNNSESWYVDVMFVRKEISSRSGY